MSVYKPARRTTYEYDFEYQGQRYRDNTFQTTKADAERVEAKVKEKLRHHAGGIAIADREDSPRFQDWAEIFYEHKAKRLERPEALGDILPVALRFWGRPEGLEPSDEHPCHDLRLCDPIDEPDWILQYEAWLERRGLSNQSKNHYRGLIRRMYTIAMLPEYRKRTGIYYNPFAGVPNDPTVPRDVTIEKAQLRAWIGHASYHVRLAMAIAALAHKLRMRNVLDLQWGLHFDPDPRQRFNPKIPHYIKMARHKTARRIRRPLVAPVPAQLLRILKDAWQRDPQSEYVVTYRRRPIHSITDGVKAAAIAAGLPYGRDVRDTDGQPIGVTFHTLRHAVTTLLSDQLEDPMKLMDAAGHTDLATTLRYRHTQPRHQRSTVERFSRSLKIEDLVTQPRRRAARR